MQTQGDGCETVLCGHHRGVTLKGEAPDSSQRLVRVTCSNWMENSTEGNLTWFALPKDPWGKEWLSEHREVLLPIRHYAFVYIIPWGQPSSLWGGNKAPTSLRVGFNPSLSYLSRFWTLSKISFLEDEFTYISMRFKKWYTPVATTINFQNLCTTPQSPASCLRTHLSICTLKNKTK